MTTTATPGKYWFLCAISLMGVCAALLAPHDQYFFGNFAWYWLPLAAVITLLAVAGTRPAALVGCSVALIAFLVAYHSYALSAKDSMVWLGYLFAMPGAIAGGFVAHFWFRARRMEAIWCGVLSMFCTIFGLATNMGVMCFTLISCRI